MSISGEMFVCKGGQFGEQQRTAIVWLVQWSGRKVLATAKLLQFEEGMSLLPCRMQGQFDKCSTHMNELCKST